MGGTSASSRFNTRSAIRRPVCTVPIYPCPLYVAHQALSGFHWQKGRLIIDVRCQAPPPNLMLTFFTADSISVSSVRYGIAANLLDSEKDSSRAMIVSTLAD
ncbi:hypothetical protein [Methylobacterium longum]|uniref:Uncharacterized protein n=1 Tax=Methylobacterium longum TaxID=767694 RepID=A0ABT8AKG6_9HYPH|nr:hypothetical protein [Methylobacterium longum]MDN3570145.1 hypothetical protein [Methylobacterium longum]